MLPAAPIACRELAAALGCNLLRELSMFELAAIN